LNLNSYEWLSIIKYEVNSDKSTDQKIDLVQFANRIHYNFELIGLFEIDFDLILFWKFRSAIDIYHFSDDGTNDLRINSIDLQLSTRSSSRSIAIRSINDRPNSCTSLFFYKRIFVVNSMLSFSYAERIVWLFCVIHRWQPIELKIFIKVYSFRIVGRCLKIFNNYQIVVLFLRKLKIHWGILFVK